MAKVSHEGAEMETLRRYAFRSARGLLRGATGQQAVWNTALFRLS